MKANYKLRVFAMAVLISICAPALAIMPGSKTGAPKSQSSAFAADPLIERGGSVSAVNLAKGIVSVDQKDYPFLPGTTPISYRDSGRVASANDLRQGTKIEFSTKLRLDKTEQIESIQIVSNPSK